MSLHQGGILLKCVFHSLFSEHQLRSKLWKAWEVSLSLPGQLTVQQEPRHEGMGVMEAWADLGGVTPLIHSTMNPFDLTPGSASALGCILCMSPGPALRASRQWDLKNEQLLAQRERDRRERQETFLVEDSVDTGKDGSKMHGVDLIPEHTGGCVERD